MEGLLEKLDELAKGNIPLNSLKDWHRLHDHGAPRQEPPPLTLLPHPSGHPRRAPRQDLSHKRVERLSPHAKGDYDDGLRLGQKGWLQVESLDAWWGKYGRPISIDSDIKKYASLVLRRPPDPLTAKKNGIPQLPRWTAYPDTSADLRVKRMHDSFPIRRFERTWSEKLARSGFTTGEPGASKKGSFGGSRQTSAPLCLV